MCDFDWNGVLELKVFHTSPRPPLDLDIATAKDYPVETKVPGYLCQAARIMVGLSQQELHELSRVSKKTINDYENGIIEIRAPLVGRVVAALREAGIRFLVAPEFVGVVMIGARADLEERIRRRRARQTETPGKASGSADMRHGQDSSARRPRGRPRKPIDS